MKFLFDDESFSFETLRAAAYANYGGADLGDVLVTARAIPEGDEDAWCREWKATAERVEALGRQSQAAGHAVSAREALLRASNYYRTAEFYRRENPWEDAEAKDLFERSRATFLDAMTLFDFRFERVEIPYEDTTLPGYLYLVDDRPRPTVIFNGGYDSTLEESYVALAAAALARGYHVLAFDGPGQGAALREQRLTFRPDWESVLTPVVDYALTRPEIAPDAVTVFGYSMGGFLVARAAAFESRFAGVIVDDGIYDFYSAMTNAMPQFLVEWVEHGNDEAANAVIRQMMSASTNIRWVMGNGMWTFGLDSPAELARAFRSYTLAGIADRITAPVLVLDAENDQFLKGEPARAAAAMVNSRTTLATMYEADGAGEHCHLGALHHAHQVVFDWLDELVGA
jgi:pimeloyl-ACP methyl ester carboxylesterase